MLVIHGEEYSSLKRCKSWFWSDEIKKHDFILTPGRYVGFEETEDDDEEFEEKMERLTAELSEQFRKSEELEKKIK